MIFDDEQIFGYQGLEIKLRFSASDMRPNLAVAYTKKFKSTGETEAADVTGVLRVFLPEGAPKLYPCRPGDEAN